MTVSPQNGIRLVASGFSVKNHWLYFSEKISSENISRQLL